MKHVRIITEKNDAPVRNKGKDCSDTLEPSETQTTQQLTVNPAVLCERRPIESCLHGAKKKTKTRLRWGSREGTDGWTVLSEPEKPAVGIYGPPGSDAPASRLTASSPEPRGPPARSPSLFPHTFAGAGGGP